MEGKEAHMKPHFFLLESILPTERSRQKTFCSDHEYSVVSLTWKTVCSGS